MDEKKLSALQKEYRDFFLNKLEQFEVKSPAHLSLEKKRKFFNEIKQDWGQFKQSRENTFKKNYDQISKNPKKSNVNSTAEDKTILKLKEYEKQDKKFESDIQKNVLKVEQSKIKIKSVPNPEQTVDLKLLYLPNQHFDQEGQYLYPVVKMPKPNSVIKLPREGRSNQKGYKEDDFYTELKRHFTDIEISNNFHMVIPNFTRPYEPDIVLFDKSKNLYIDIEIDEPYDGFYRYPTHNYRAEDGFKQDDIRDLFFTESGWIVIRFTEKQIHKYSNKCIDFIVNVINSIHGDDFNSKPKCEIEPQWNENQSIQWQLNHYREKYLEIVSFRKIEGSTQIIVDEHEVELVEDTIHRTKFEDIEKQFDKDLHKYFHQNDPTGNAEYISVTTLIERFFQFDILRYIEREAEKQNKDEVIVLKEFLEMRDEAAVFGTELHLQIENYFTKKPYDNSLKEFKYFLEFEKEKIITKGLIFAEAEKKIFMPKYKVAGTVDCLFKRLDGRYVMVDWKRSKKLIVKGTEQPDKRGFRIEIEGLTKLTNCSYYRYCIQQNIYKHILKEEYNITVSDMILVVLHENYSKYHTIRLPEMLEETAVILSSIDHKI
jgi:hypothetical protein